MYFPETTSYRFGVLRNVQKEIWGNPNTSESQNAAYALKVMEVRSGTVTPHYRKILSGDSEFGSLLPVNEFFYRKRTFAYPYGWKFVSTSEMKSTGMKLIRTQELTGNTAGQIGLVPRSEGNVSDRAISALDSKALTKALLNVKNQKVNLGQVFAERKQTFDLVASTATAIRDAIIHLRKGDLAGAAKSVGVYVSKRHATRYRREVSAGNLNHASVSTGVLKIQYGIRPLLQDIYGAVDEMTTHNLNEIRTRAKGSAIATFETHSKESGQPDTTLITTKSRVQITYRFVFSISDNTLQTASRLGLTNPAILFWELTPWSFVVDWFLPIGNFLNTWDATLGVAFVSGGKTTFRTELTQFDTVSDGVLIYGVRTTGHATSSYEEVYVKRDGLSSFPWPVLPSFKNPLSAEHAINALALLTQLVRR